MVLRDGAMRRCYEMVLWDGATRQCYEMVLWDGAMRWCYETAADSTLQSAEETQARDVWWSDQDRRGKWARVAAEAHMQRWLVRQQCNQWNKTALSMNMRKRFIGRLKQAPQGRHLLLELELDCSLSYIVCRVCVVGFLSISGFPRYYCCGLYQRLPI